MRKRLSYLYLILLAAILIWLLVDHPPTRLFLLVLVCAIPVLIGMGYVCIRILDAWRDFLYQKRMQQLLGNMTIEEVLDLSPYAYGYVFQGDDGYRIWRKGTTDGFVQSGVSKKAAEMWIVEEYFKN